MRIRGTWTALVGLAGVLVILATGGVSSAQDADEPLPLPVDKTAILRKDGAVYYVEGRVTIPAGVEVTILNDIEVFGRGEGATIAVEGSFVVHGVREREVVFHDVTIEVQPEFEDLHMDMAILDGGGVRGPEGAAVNGDIFFELFDFVHGATLDVRVASGSVELSTVCSETPVKIEVVPPEDATDNKIKVNIRGCGQGTLKTCEPHPLRIGLRGGLEVSGAQEIVVRSTRVGGDLCAIRNWQKSLIFDACKIQSKALEVTHDAAGYFAKAQFAKCDVYSPSVLFRAPVEKGKKDTAHVQRFFFAGEGDEDVVMEKIVKDAADDPEHNGVVVRLDKVKTRAHEMAGPAE